MTDKSRATPLAVLALRPAPGARAAAARWQDAEATVTVRGELDRDAIWAIDYTIARASAEAGRIVLDLREVTHVDYRGVPALVDRCKELRRDTYTRQAGSQTPPDVSPHQASYR